MKLIRCEHGHYYDTQQHSRCPSCGAKSVANTLAQLKSAESETSVGITQVRGQAVSGDVGVTVAMVRKTMGFDPVVGWLVCVQGPERGRDYRIRSERNGIGRGADMAVCIMSDDTISRENHAFITYNPRKLSFRLAPGEGRGMVYLNGEEVDAPMPLLAYDRIELGQTHLIFIPLCSEQFHWEGETK